MKFFDGINHPSAATVVADGLDGAMLYLGTPTSRKDVTAAQYADYKAHGLKTIVGFEHVVDDWRGGATAGKANAAAFLADARAKGVDPGDPFWVAIDEHVAKDDLSTVVAYVRAYVQTVRAAGWRGAAGVYGFPEVTTAVEVADVCDWYWGTGRRADQPPFVNVWQDNTQHITVGGASDDVDWVLNPIPTAQETGVELTDPISYVSRSDGTKHTTTVGEALAAAQDLFDQLTKGNAAAGGGPAGWWVQQFLVPDHTTLGQVAEQLGGIADVVGQLAADVAALKAAQQPDTLTGQATVTVQLNPGSPA